MSFRQKGKRRASTGASSETYSFKSRGKMPSGLYAFLVSRDYEWCHCLMTFHDLAKPVFRDQVQDVSTQTCTESWLSSMLETGMNIYEISNLTRFDQNRKLKYIIYSTGRTQPQTWAEDRQNKQSHQVCLKLNTAQES